MVCGMTILCIDRHKVLLHTLSAVLPRFGFSILVAASLEEAFPILATASIDAVLLDYGLCPGCPDSAATRDPHSSGVSEHPCFAERLRASFPGVKVLVWCADGSCLKAPPSCASAVFLKPVPPDELAANLHSVLAP